MVADVIGPRTEIAAAHDLPHAAGGHAPGNGEVHGKRQARVPWQRRHHLAAHDAGAQDADAESS
jgi:hypothetical protein